MVKEELGLASRIRYWSAFSLDYLLFCISKRKRSAFFYGLAIADAMMKTIRLRSIDKRYGNVKKVLLDLLNLALEIDKYNDAHIPVPIILYMKLADTMYDARHILDEEDYNYLEKIVKIAMEAQSYDIQMRYDKWPEILYGKAGAISEISFYLLYKYHLGKSSKELAHAAALIGMAMQIADDVKDLPKDMREGSFNLYFVFRSLESLERLAKCYLRTAREIVEKHSEGKKREVMLYTVWIVEKYVEKICKKVSERLGIR